MLLEHNPAEVEEADEGENESGDEEDEGENENGDEDEDEEAPRVSVRTFFEEEAEEASEDEESGATEVLDDDGTVSLAEALGFENNGYETDLSAAIVSASASGEDIFDAEPVHEGDSVQDSVHHQLREELRPVVIQQLREELLPIVAAELKAELKRKRGIVDSDDEDEERALQAKRLHG